MPADVQASYASCQQLQDSSCYFAHIYMCHPHFFMCTKSAQLTIRCFVCPVFLPILSQGNDSVFLTQLSWQQSVGQPAGQQCSFYPRPHQGLEILHFLSHGKGSKHKEQMAKTQTELWRNLTLLRSGRLRGWKGRKRGKRNGSGWNCERKLCRDGPFVSTTQHTRWKTSIRISSESALLYWSDFLSEFFKPGHNFKTKVLGFTLH